MMTRVTCSFDFEAAHFLPMHPGKCRDVHGHSYRIEVTVVGDIQENGMVIDFDDLRTIVKREIVDNWDHKLLNDFLDNPTAELLAHHAFEKLMATGVGLHSVRLWETRDSFVEVN